MLLLNKSNMLFVLTLHRLVLKKKITWPFCITAKGLIITRKCYDIKELFTCEWHISLKKYNCFSIISFKER